jgi:hypothetical protein
MRDGRKTYMRLCSKKYDTLEEWFSENIIGRLYLGRR